MSNGNVLVVPDVVDDDQNTLSVLLVEEDTMHEIASTKLNNSAKAPPSSHHLHIVFLVDATGSMGTYLTALKTTLHEINALLRVLFPAAADVSVIAYKDYSDGNELIQKCMQAPYKKLSTFCAAICPGGGGDLAEANKTALNHLSRYVRAWKDDTTIVFHYTDAPPHHRLTNTCGSNIAKEEKSLYGKAPGFDWCKIARRFRKVSHRVKIFTIVPKDSPAGHCGAAFYALLGELVVLTGDLTSFKITKSTMDILLQLIGNGPAVDDLNHGAICQKVCFTEEEQVMDRLLSGEFNEDNFPELNTDACREPTFQPTARSNDLITSNCGIQYAALESIQQDLSKLQRRFKDDPAFCDIVFQVMSDLVQPHHIMALTVNEVFGRLWRMVCDCRFDDRVSSLTARMGGCATSKLLSEDDRFNLKTWIEESYNTSEEINAAIRSADFERCYVMDHAQGLDATALRSLARAPTASALASLQQILSHIILVDTDHMQIASTRPVDDDGNCRYIPESFDDYQLFKFLPHLIVVGTQYSLKAAALLAILCCQSKGSLLEKRAQRFLLSVRGKWLPAVDAIDRAEILSDEFSSLLAKCDVEGALTDAERQFFRRLHEIWRYRRSRRTTFDVTTPLSPATPMLLPDLKHVCRDCKQWTSRTLMDQTEKCGICLWKQDSPNHILWDRPKRGEEYFVEDSESFIVECTVCRALYAVLGPKDLNVAPKCHYCRGLCRERHRKLGAPFNRCGCCKAKWCAPSLLIEGDDESGDFLCPVCTHYGGEIGISSRPPQASTSIHRVNLNEIVTQNPTCAAQLGLRKKAAEIIFSQTTLYNGIMSHREALFLPPRLVGDKPSFSYNGRVVHNAEGLISTIHTSISLATFVGTCQLCYDEMATERLWEACGQCSNRCCMECLSSWYGLNSPGGLFIPSHDMCPFCRRRPKYQVLSRFNHQACGIVGLSRRNGKALELRTDVFYGWCQQCWKVAYAVDRTCAGEVPTFTNFVCEDCVEKNVAIRIAEQAATDEERTQMLLARAKPCPKCNVRTAHMGGCSHMTCTKCKIHWCWQCGTFKADSAAEVYNHMIGSHGGYGWMEEADD